MKVLLIVYDNNSYIHVFPIGLAYIAAMLRNFGCEVVIYNQDQHHYPEEHLTEFLNKNKFDAIGIGIIAGYTQYRKLLKISEAINKSKNRPPYIIGGHGPSPEPEFFLRKTGADVVVMGEGESTVVDLLKHIASKKPLSDVEGIAYCDNGKVIINKRRPLIKDIDSLPWPAYDLFSIEYYRLLRMPHVDKKDFVMPMLSGRGCKFRCIFCYRMDKGFRPRKAEAILEEILFLKKEYGITYIAFMDELLMSSIARTEEICRIFIKAKIGMKWDCNGRLNYADKDLLRLMKEAGCVFINYGIESFDDVVLKNIRKNLTTQQITKGIEATLDAGISPGLNIIFGNPGDNNQTLKNGVKFLLKYDDGAQMRTIRPVSPYPGSELYSMAIEQGLLKDCRDFYERAHVNTDLLTVNFTDLSNDEFHEALYKANSTLIKNYYKNQLNGILEKNRKLYLEKDVSFSGFRTT
ncbi:B12-binding domain-containing radical SAM protein [Patescibacteria group bacterium]|nr:B12-binding domain-containing radical SAM protein [Patescibacteria group bacterium]